MALTAFVTAIIRLRDAVHLLDLAAANKTAHTALKVTLAALKLDLTEGHFEPAWANLIGAATAVEINLAKADIARFLAYRPAT